MGAELTSSADSVHRNVARLSISTEDVAPGRDFIASLISEKATRLDQDSSVAIEEEDEDEDESEDKPTVNDNSSIPTTALPSTDETISTTGQSNVDSNEEAISGDSPNDDSSKEMTFEKPVRPKRRRSSVQQTHQLRKKKFLTTPTFNYLWTMKAADIGDIQNLIIDSLTSASDLKKSKTSKFGVKNAASIEKVMLVLIPGLNSEDFNTSKIVGLQPFTDSKLPFFNENFKEVFEFRHPGTKQNLYDFGMTFNKIRLNHKQKKTLTASFSNPSKDDAIVITDLLMKAPFMYYDKYPYPIHPDTPDATPDMLERYSDYVDTVKVDHEGSHIFAMDCEMCRAESGHVLTRISIVDFSGTVILDELVKPEEEIIDYATKYSGITEEMLRDVTTTLKDIQDKILKTISSEDILIGHSLESDLHALKMRHPRILDTSFIYDHPMGPPAKASLKSLMKLHFDKDIQNSESGHDSIEDSESCLDLVKLKITKGLMYGKCPEQYIFEKIVTRNKHYLINGEKKPKSSLIVDFKKNFERPDVAKHISCTSRAEVIEKTLDNMADHELIVVNMGASRVHREEPQMADSSEDHRHFELTPEERQQQLLEISEGLQDLYDELPVNSMVIIASTVASKRDIGLLQKQKRDFERDFNNPDVRPWTIEDSNLLDSKVFKARAGACLIKIKGSNSSVDEDDDDVPTEAV